MLHPLKEKVGKLEDLKSQGQLDVPSQRTKLGTSKARSLEVHSCSTAADLHQCRGSTGEGQEGVSPKGQLVRCCVQRPRQAQDKHFGSQNRPAGAGEGSVPARGSGARGQPTMGGVSDMPAVQAAHPPARGQQGPACGKWPQSPGTQRHCHW